MLRRASLHFSVMVLCAACGGPNAPPADATACPNNLPTSCPSPAPDYASVSNIFQTTCVPCHQPGAVGAPRYFQSYAEVYSQRQTVLDQVYACAMPPLDAGQLTSAQRVELLTWMVCGSPM